MKSTDFLVACPREAHEIAACPTPAVADPWLPDCDQPDAGESLPIFSQLFGVCNRGPGKAWDVQGRVARRAPERSLSSLAAGRV